MILKKNFLLIKKLIFYFILILFGIYFSYIKGYGQDIDTWREIYSYLELRESGQYIPSRWNLYGHPLAELILGFLTYYLDTFYVNFFIYVLLITSLYFFFITFLNKKKPFFFLLCLCLTNPVLIFDNINISDNVLSLFFFSIGTYLLLKKNNYLDWSPLFFGLAIATRINFIIYFTILIFFFFFIKKIKYIKIFNIFFFSLLIGSLFYLPIFFQNKLTLNFLYNDAGPPLAFFDLFPRFAFKLYQSIGIYSSFLILIFFFFLRKKIIKNHNFILIILILSNFLMFFFIPTKTTILSLSIIFIYIIIVSSSKKKFMILVIILNIFSWFLTFSFIEIKYKYVDPCREIVATDAIFKISIKSGFYKQKIMDLKRRILCDAPNLKKFGKEKNYIEGKRMIKSIN